MTCPRCGAPAAPGERFCARCGGPLAPAPAAGAAAADEAVATVIPYRNVPALIAYYLGVFSLVPGLGVALAIPAIVLGVIGRRRHRRDERAKGSVHSWIGIGLGSFSLLVHVLFFVLLAGGAFD